MSRRYFSGDWIIAIGGAEGGPGREGGHDVRKDGVSFSIPSNLFVIFEVDEA